VEAMSGNADLRLSIVTVTFPRWRFFRFC
jgi:hypothetical protein